MHEPSEDGGDTGKIQRMVRWEGGVTEVPSASRGSESRPRWLFLVMAYGAVLASSFRGLHLMSPIGNDFQIYGYLSLGLWLWEINIYGKNNRMDTRGHYFLSKETRPMYCIRIFIFLET